MLKNSRQTALILAAVLTAGLLSGGFLLAAKGGKPPKDDPPPLPETTIYFTPFANFVDSAHAAMNTDGSGKVEVMPDGFRGVPSHLVYGADGHRWWLTIEEVGDGQTYPGTATPRREAYASRPVILGDGTLDRDRFQLTNTFDPNRIVAPSRTPRWSNDGGDSFVSFEATVEDEMGEFVSRLVRVPFVIDAGGNPTVVEEHVVFDIPGCCAFDWSPDGEQVVTQIGVFNDGIRTDLLFVFNVTLGTSLQLFPDDAFTPTWQPDPDDTGITRIAFESGDDIWTINPDGTGATLVHQSPGFPKGVFRSPSWSPDGEHLLFQFIHKTDRRKGTTSPFGSNSDVVRAPAQGGAVVDLTKDLDIGGHAPVAWRW